MSRIRINLELPRNCTCLELIHGLNQIQAFSGDWEKMMIVIPEDCFVSSSAMVFLCSWGLRQRADGRTFLVRDRSGAGGYLARMDLMKKLDVVWEDEAKHRPETGRFIPLQTITDDQSVLTTTHLICDLVLQQIDRAAEFLPALEWAVYEIIDNILIHSELKTPGAVCAQFFPNERRLDIGICDCGRGILASLSEAMPLQSHGQAISKAVLRGVTRNSAVGMGNGLAGSIEIIKANGGKFDLWSGDVVYRVRPTGKDEFQSLPVAVDGTGVLFSFNTAQPVNLETTFIANSGWSYINFLADQVSEKGGIKIVENCIHTGGRRPATALRRKISALLSEMNSPLVLDFVGVRTASSSFLDELLGRLVAELGEQQFHRKIQITNASKTVADSANVVIHQRLGTGAN